MPACPAPCTLVFCVYCFFLNDTATTEIYTLSLHDALPIWRHHDEAVHERVVDRALQAVAIGHRDRKSTRLNSSHTIISYAVLCLKKKHTFLCFPHKPPPHIFFTLPHLLSVTIQIGTAYRLICIYWFSHN